MITKKLQKIYIDTSVFGGCFDKEFKHPSNMLIKKLISGDLLTIISEITEIEMSKAPDKVKQLFKEIPELNIIKCDLSNESIYLSERYIIEGIISSKYKSDAQHIAIATIFKADAIASWNFKHIVNLQRIRGFNSVNLKYGYPFIEIRTPWEVLSYEE